MKTTSRREFIKSSSVLGLTIPLLSPTQMFGQTNDLYAFDLKSPRQYSPIHTNQTH
jgi:hypothetical protein